MIISNIKRIHCAKRNRWKFKIDNKEFYYIIDFNRNYTRIYSISLYVEDYIIPGCLPPDYNILDNFKKYLHKHFIAMMLQ